jgi:hypothetical protein
MTNISTIVTYTYEHLGFEARRLIYCAHYAHKFGERNKSQFKIPNTHIRFIIPTSTVMDKEEPYRTGLYAHSVETAYEMYHIVRVDSKQ